jgi:hypothetical protein
MGSKNFAKERARRRWPPVDEEAEEERRYSGED